MKDVRFILARSQIPIGLAAPFGFLGYPLYMMVRFTIAQSGNNKMYDERCHLSLRQRSDTILEVTGKMKFFSCRYINMYILDIV